MKGGVGTALALGVGYILGRHRKMRLATMLAVGAATGGAAKFGPAALRQGTKYLGKTDIAGALGPQVAEIVNTVRGELLDAAKGAATAAVTNRIDSLSDNLHDRAETLRNPEAAVGKAGEAAGETVGRAGETVGKAGETVGKAGETVGRVSGKRRRRREADIEDEPDGEERSNGRARRERSRASDEPDEYDEPADEYEDEDLDEAPADEADEADEPEDEAEEPAPRRRRSTRSPVVRARR